MISLLCPTRGRVEQAEKLLVSFLQTQKNNNELWFYIQSDDVKADSYLEMLRGYNHKTYIYAEWNPTGYLWNYLSDKANGDLVGVMGDDVVIETEGWDNKIEHYSKKHEDNIFVLAPNGDGKHVRGNIYREVEVFEDIRACHPIVHKKWIEILGYFVPPQFMHRYLDAYTVELAISIKRYIQMRDVYFRHQKTSYWSDETGKLSRSWIKFDKFSYENTKRQFEGDKNLLQSYILK